MIPTELAPRALNSQRAMSYLGVRRRVWESIKRQLTPIRLGTAVLYDRLELDDLFARLKSEQLARLDRNAPTENKAVLVLPREVATSSSDGRPSQLRKGDKPWAVSKASTLTQTTGNGGLTSSCEANEFRVVMERIRKRSAPS